ncbi:MAG: anaerobic ribonucleoside-triphosphate reductase activating protein [Eggerthellaceae bacterium]|nr:anaerobic ribonucleoside-triphosphate reductase activating protein [Eggerthellaceae bacterium]
MSKINLFGTVSESIVDGPGLRYVVFTQGCPYHCKGCHNPQSQEFVDNIIMEVQDVIEDIKATHLIQGVTLSGGDPFSQAGPCGEMAKKLKELAYNVWCYTGNLYENHLEISKHDHDVASLLNNIDVLVDGPFIESKMSYTIDWCGSTNQRVIDMNKTRETGELVLYKIEKSLKGSDLNFTKPDSW